MEDTNKCKHCEQELKPWAPSGHEVYGYCSSKCHLAAKPEAFGGDPNAEIEPMESPQSFYKRQMRELERLVKKK
jgi:hypothetical protein